jgi:hypothetical protein
MAVTISWRSASPSISVGKRLLINLEIFPLSSEGTTESPDRRPAARAVNSRAESNVKPTLEAIVF